MNPAKVVIIGGGITGLTAAYTIKQLFDDGTVQCTVLEQSPRFGGQIVTHREDSLILDLGPDTLLHSQHGAEDLIRDLGVGAEMVVADPATEDTYLWTGGHLVPMPTGTVLGVPTSFASIWNNPWLSFPGKLRALTDYMTPRAKDKKPFEDGSLGLFLRRHLGDEWVDKVCEPLLSNPGGLKLDDMSLLGTYPELPQMALQHGSLIRAFREQRSAVATRHTPLTSRLCYATHPDTPALPNPIPAVTLRNGLQTLTEQLFDSLRHFADLRVNRQVARVFRLENGQYVIEANDNEDSETLIADAVIVCTPAPVAGQLLCGLSAKAAKLSAVRYGSMATVMMGYPAEALSRFPGTGFVSWSLSDTIITSCEIVSRRWPHTTSDGRILVRCDIGKTGQTDWTSLDDAGLAKRVGSELSGIFKSQEKPWFTKVTRFHRAIPQYEPGHRELVEEVEAALATDVPGIYVAGAGYHGAGLSACIANARRAAMQVAKRFNGS